MAVGKSNMFNAVRRTSIYRFAGKIYRQLQTRQHRAAKGKGYYCPGCEQNWKDFRPISQSYFDHYAKNGWPYSLDDAETLNYKNYTCYGCGISDRDRLYILFLEKTLQPAKHYDIVEFAPSAPLTRKLRAMPNVTLRTADLFKKDVDDNLDLQDLYLYKDNSFDIFICSHILEHVENDIKAMKELYRILKPGGVGIAMVPIIEPVVETIEDPSIKDEKSRIKYFGQEDHVRLYAKQDFIKRLESVNFKVKLYTVNDFGEQLFDGWGITRKSVLYTVEK